MKYAKIIILLLIPLMVLSNLAMLESEAFTLGGHPTRLRVNMHYYHDEDIIIEVKAARTDTNGNVLSDENVNIKICRSIMINGIETNTEWIYNSKIPCSNTKWTKINLGKFDLGSYKIAVEFVFVDNHIEKKSEQLSVSHAPIEYELIFLDGGEEISFRSRVEGETFDIQIYLGFPDSSELYQSISNVSSKKITIKKPKNTISVSVIVKDNYGNENSMDIRHEYSYIENEDKTMQILVIISIWIVSLVGIGVLIKILNRGGDK